MFSKVNRYATPIILSALLLLFLIGCGGGGGSGDGGSDGYTITGKISLSDGTPVNGATVKLYKTSYTIYSLDTADGEIYSTRDLNGSDSVSLDLVVRSTSTNKFGIYSFTGVSGGNYTIAPSHPTYVFRWSNVPTRSNIGIVTITDSGMVYFYNPDGLGNKRSDDGTIIYNIGIPSPIADNVLGGQDFDASLPGGSGL